MGGMRESQCMDVCIEESCKEGGSLALSLHLKATKHELQQQQKGRIPGAQLAF